MLDEYIKSEASLSCLDRKSLDEWTFSRLKEVVAYAKEHSSFYRERLLDLKVESMEDFKKLPFTTPKDLSENYKQMVCVSGSEVDRVVTLSTSGSTGYPKRVYFTENDQMRTARYFGEGMAEFVDAGERVLSLFPGESAGSLNDLLGRGLKEKGVELFVFGYPRPDDYDRVLDMIEENSITSLVGSAVSIADMAGYSKSADKLDKVKTLKSVLLAAAFVSDENEAAIKEIWGVKVNEHYGMTETALAGAVGCPVSEGYHMWESGLYYEIIDPDTGECVKPGEEGEIVVTTLFQEAMPMIRYRTGDISSEIMTPCDCGSILRRMKRIKSRPQEKKFTERVIKEDRLKGIFEEIKDE